MKNKTEPTINAVTVEAIAIFPSLVSPLNEPPDPVHVYKATVVVVTTVTVNKYVWQYR